MPEIKLPGLQGTNPLGFFAALGALRTIARSRPDATLRWVEQPVPIPELGGVESIGELVEGVMADREHWRTAPVLTFENLVDVKLSEDELLQYLGACRDDPARSGELSAALVAQRVVDGSGASKPTDFHFTAGQQKFLQMARQIRDGVTAEDLEGALSSDWTYKSDLPSLMWDVTDDRVYALAAVNPAKEKKLSEPGAEWLALLGLTCLPVAIGSERTLTPGCRGTWKYGAFTWPLWSTPIGAESCRSLIAATSEETTPEVLGSRGCFVLLRSDIRRSDQGGYGTFGPPVAIWQRRIEQMAPSDPFA